MIYNYFGTVLFIIVSWMTGLAALKLAGFDKFQYRYYSYASIPIGISICALIAVLFYLKLGLSVNAVQIAYCILCLISCVILIKKKTHLRECRNLLYFLCIFTIMILPGILHGDKYYIHRGNIGDQYSYLAEVIYMGLHNISYGSGKMLTDENVSEVLTYGFSALSSDRPAVSLLCAVLTGKSWGNVFFQAYLFLTMAWAAIFGSMMLALEMFMEKWSELRKHKNIGLIMGVLSLIYIWGFYGQIQYDINSWPQLVSASSLLAFSCIYFLCLSDIFSGKSLPLRRYLFIAITGTGIFLIYPENTMIYGALLAGVTLFTWLFKRCHLSLKILVSIAILPLLITGIVSILHWGTIQVALSQIETAESDIRQSWASYFDQYWLGFFPYVDTWGWKSSIKKCISLAPSLFGMYILAPNYGIKSKLLKYPWIIAAIILGLGILLILCTTIKQIWNQKALPEEKSEKNHFFLLMTILGLLIFGEMFLRQKYWSAGKLLLYISPYLYLMMIYPICNLISGKKRIRNLWIHYTTVVSCIFLLCQIFMAGLRVSDTLTNQNCTGYLGSYPSDQYPYLKENFGYRFDAKRYVNKENIVVNIDDGWYQDYVEMALTYEGISFYSYPDWTFSTYQKKDSQFIMPDGAILIQVEDTE